MQNIMKKLFMLTSILGVVAIMGGCSSSKDQNKPNKSDMEYYQTYEDSDVTKVNAKMYTHSKNGGQSRMGHIKFTETSSGLKMAVDLKDMRPGVEYTINVYEWDCNDKGTKCEKDKLSLNLPMLKSDNSGKLEETFVVRGLTAKQLKNAKLVLSREGSDKAAWGMLEPTMF